MLITCSILPEQRGINTDHLPILTELRLEVDITEVKDIPNFQYVNWEDFRDELQKQLDKARKPACISNQAQLNKHCEELYECPIRSHTSDSPSDRNHAQIQKVVD